MDSGMFILLVGFQSAPLFFYFVALSIADNDSENFFQMVVYESCYMIAFLFIGCSLIL